MKINDKKELHGKSATELKTMLKDGYELLLQLKLDREQNKLKNTRGLFNTRKNIAIIKTILRGKEGETENSKSEVRNPKQVEKTTVKAKKPETEKVEEAKV